MKYCLGVLFILLFILLLCNLTGAYELGVAPTKVNFEIELEDIKCAKIDLISENYRGEVDIRSKWKRNFSYSAIDYKLDALDLGLEVRHPERITLSNDKDFVLCVRPERNGLFFGVLMLEAEQANIKLNVWIRVDTGKEENLFDIMVKRGVTGFVSFNDPGIDVGKAVLISSVGVTMGLVGFLFYLLRIKRAIEKEEEGT